MGISSQGKIRKFIVYSDTKWSAKGVDKFGSKYGCANTNVSSLCGIISVKINGTVKSNTSADLNQQ